MAALDPHGEREEDCPADKNYLVTLTYNVSDVCCHEEAKDEFFAWLATTKDVVVQVSEVPLGTNPSDPQEWSARGREDV